MKTETVTTALLAIYNFAWQAVLPLLKKHQRLKTGFIKRTSAAHFSKCDIWIQAASAGEAYLACALVKQLRFRARTRVLITTLTVQGMEILEKELALQLPGPLIDPSVQLTLAWFPFDMPLLMADVVRQVDPAIMVLLETELWPGLLSCLKKRDTEVLMVNARLSEGSFNRYLWTAFAWRALAPGTILAVSEQEAQRFAALFPKAVVRVMPNIKFDALAPGNINTPGRNTAAVNLPKNRFAPGIPTTILASVRREEEALVQKILVRLFKGFPRQIVAIFPRHMERINTWANRLTQAGYCWHLRSRTANLSAVKAGTVILWDQFGELKQAYTFATAAFVGGSLLPLGGQNFMEPVMAGAATVTGPHLKDFLWVGEDIFKHKIVHRAENWQQVADFIIESLLHVPDREHLKQQGRDFVQRQQGGTKLAVNQITRSLQRRKWNP